MVNLDGFNIIEVVENVWVLEVINGISYTGTLKEVVTLAINNYKFRFKEIEDAVNCMIREEHNAAHFGTWGSFIYTFNQNSPKRSLAS